MTLLLQAAGIVLFVALMFIAFAVLVFIGTGNFVQRIARMQEERADMKTTPVYPPPAASARVWPKPEGVYLRKWTAGRKLDARREQEQWEKDFGHLL